MKKIIKKINIFSFLVLGVLVVPMFVHADAYTSWDTGYSDYDFYGSSGYSDYNYADTGYSDYNYSGSTGYSDYDFYGSSGYSDYNYADTGYSDYNFYNSGSYYTTPSYDSYVQAPVYTPNVDWSYNDPVYAYDYGFNDYGSGFNNYGCGTGCDSWYDYDYGCGTVCPPPYNPPPYNPPVYDDLEVVCRVSDTRPEEDERVTFTADVDGGRGSYIYRWYGDVYGSERTVSKRFSLSGAHYVYVQVTDRNGHTETAECPVVRVDEEEDSEVTSGTLSSGTTYYTNIPTGNLASVGSVYLNQVPYTGPEDVAKGVAFVVAILAWSIAGALIIRNKMNKKVISNNVLAFKEANKAKFM
jgi:hypothetical protein